MLQTYATERLLQTPTHVRHYASASTKVLPIECVNSTFYFETQIPHINRQKLISVLKLTKNKTADS